MALSPSIILSAADKLDTLRRLDQFRQWRSLDEKRYCLVCGKIITGRQIKVAGGTRGNASLRIKCPTERCNSIPMDWVLPTDEVLTNFALLETEHRNVAVVHTDRGARENSIGSRLRRLALRLKRSV